MHDPWTDRLSDYLDGELSADDRRACDEHLAVCDVCRTTLAELRDVVAAAHALEPTPPEHDLWPGIAAAIGARNERTTLPFTKRSRWHISFTLPQLAAAAVALMALSGTSVWLLTRAPSGVEPVSGTLVHAAAEPPSSAQLVAATSVPDTAFETTVAALERTLAQNRQQLDPATIEVLERSVAAIDRAIAESRAALAADPANPHLHRQLESTMQKKIDVLRRATRVRRAGT